MICDFSKGQADRIETRRLTLRRFQPGDWPALHRALSDPEVVRFEPYGPFTEAASRYEALARADNKAFWAVCRKDGSLIGNVYLDARAHGGRELGCVLARDAWGRGYATEAARAVVDRAFAEGARRVYAQCSPENRASCRLLERLGMRREAHFRLDAPASRPGAPAWQDTYVYAILRDEWPVARGNNAKEETAHAQ